MLFRSDLQRSNSPFHCSREGVLAWRSLALRTVRGESEKRVREEEADGQITRLDLRKDGSRGLAMEGGCCDRGSSYAAGGGEDLKAKLWGKDVTHAN